MFAAKIEISIMSQFLTAYCLSVIHHHHNTLQFCITPKVCKYITTARTILIEENGCFPSLVDQNPNIALLIVINYFFPGILEPFLKDVIRNFVFNTKRLERFSIRQGLGLVLKVKPFKIFTAIHKS